MLEQIKEILPDRRIAVFLNHKGGVAKTTSVANIGFNMAAMGYRLLLIDLDPQGNLSKNFCNMDTIKPKMFAHQLFMDQSNISLLNPRNNVYMIPADYRMSQIEPVISNKIEREKILRNKLAKIVEKDMFDAILIDCPTNPSQVNINALVAANVLIVPIMGESFALQGLSMLEEEIQQIKQNLNPGLGIDKFIIGRYNPTAGINRDVAKYLSDNYPDRVFNTRIRQCLKISEAQLRHQTVMEYMPKCNGSKDYQMITNEFVEFLTGAPLNETKPEENNN